MTDVVRLYFDAVVASTASVVSFAASTVAPDPVSTWLFGGGFVALALAVFAYGQLTQKVRGTEDRLKRIEEKVDTLVSDVAVALDRTGAA